MPSDPVEESVAPTASSQGDLFCWAASPMVELDQILKKILDKAIELARADVGAAIFLDEPENGETELVLRAISGIPCASEDHLIRQCRENVCLSSPLRAVSSDGSADHPHEAVSLFTGGRSVLHIPLDLVRFHGFLQLEASKKQSYPPARRRRLTELARRAGIVISRILLRDHARARGLDIHLIGRSPKLLELEEQVRFIGLDPNSPVLIRGERGSGKELVAYAIHYCSSRRNQPFIPVNSAAFSDTLFSDELFGHDKNAFTGAQTKREGLFSAAAGGTVFFDEVADMAPSIQAALLRVFDQGELRRLGSDEPLKADVRVICATNKNLEKMIAEGRFRADLYDRLNVFDVNVPPLRERKDDVELLASFYLKKACMNIGRHQRRNDVTACEGCFTMTAHAACAEQSLLRGLVDYDYPGNVRELKNLIVRLSAVVREDEIRMRHAAPYLKEESSPVPRQLRDLELESVIREHIREVLQLAGHNKSKAARMLGLPLTTLFNKMKKLGID